MKIAILHNAVADSDTVSDRDVLVQAAAVEQALRSQGHTTRRLPCTLNLEVIEESLTIDRPELIFNLVESLSGSDRLAHLVAVLLDDLDLRYTGASGEALHLTSNKPLAKQRLRAAGLPTPDWVVGGSDGETVLAPPYIIKAVWEHASIGMDDHAVVTTGDGSTVVAQIESRARQLGRACFAEQFIAGREFNLSLIAVSDGPRVLPPAEIDFSAFPPNKPKIVGYAAKWVEGTFEFVNTPRKFEFAANDAPLLDWLRTLAAECWHAFDLRGYARVDFRVDSQGQPWILEINANPCLAPDAGFAAALARAGISLEQAVVWIVDDVQRARRTEPRAKGQEAGSDAVGNALRGRPAAGSRESGVGDRGSAGSEFKTEDKVRSTQYSVLSTGTAEASGAPNVESAPAGQSPLATKKKKRSATTKIRTEVQPSDRDAVRRIVESTGLFRPAEIDVAVELVEARLTKGAASGYEFAFAEQKGELVGYACFGRNTLTVSSFDLYWIAVEKSKQRDGIGRLLLEEAERQIAAAGGGRIYIETSHRPDYQATRGFYERCGYKLAAVLEDFYAPGDSKAIYVKAPAGK